jgi:hypothetical protein
MGKLEKHSLFLESITSNAKINFLNPQKVHFGLCEAPQRRAEASLRAVGEVIPKDSAKPISY